ncbi:hypothetical protein E4U43_001495 [Claviceps pusilla]|uniref:CFEM domain-containing protein n=1 Tax=Claviceps pusilla TaxID=123648 RepID=A0A9P7SY70_9HYPO|nr:hypothetical protein E4U43_001495 [Claviceps pusilla]
MKVSAVASVAVAGLVSAQSISDIPECAMPCLSTAVTAKTTCAVADFACLCEKANFAAVQAAATGCVVEKCGAAKAVSDVLPATQKLCAAASSGGSGDSSSSSAAGTPSETPAPSDDGSDDDDDAPTSTASASHPEKSCDEGHGTGQGEPHTTPVPMPMPMPMPGHNGTATAPKPTTPVTAGAAGLAPVGALVFAAGLFAL